MDASPCQRSASRAVPAAPVYDQGIRTELDEIGLVERTDDRVEMCLEQRQQRSVGDVAGRDH